MPVYSMTGFATGRKPLGEGTGECQAGKSSGLALVLDLRSVNSRFLDISLRLPDELRAHEPALRERLAQRLKRGKVELRAFLHGHNGLAPADPPPALLQQLAGLQDKVRAWLPDARPLSVADVQRMVAGASAAPTQVPAATMLGLAEQVLQEFIAAREREGARLTALLRVQMAQLRELTQQAEPLVPQAVESHRQRFVARWTAALTSTDPSAASATVQERALAEATTYAIRIDVAEELGRLRAHLDEIESVLDRGGELGKRLDFMIQELHREANTLGSKSGALELSRIGVDMKVLVEQMREQVQNIE